LIGSVTGFLFIKNRFSFRIILCTFFISLAVVAILILSKSADFNPFLVAITTGILFASLIYGVATLDIRKLSRRPFKKYASPVLVLMGDAAYSIFLSHIIFIPYLCIAFNKILNVPVIPEFFKNILIVVLLFLTIVAGIATYLLIERPLLNFLRKQFRLRRHKKSWI
jgi:peptidoglycan/LPS O-acetylase OafA/YrhL